jgi:ketosteroid isomerase-like protein
MSQENVETVVRQFDAWSRGDLDAWAEAWDPEVVVLAPDGWPEGEVERGLEAWRRQAKRLRESWEEARIEIDEIRSVKPGVILAQIRYVTRGGETGIAFETPMAAVFFLHEQKITRAQYGWTVAEALEAAGLSE